MGKNKIHKLIVRVFWISLVFCIGFSWFDMRRAKPEKLNIAAEEEETFHFSMQTDATLHSDREAVVVLSLIHIRRRRPAI